MNNQSNYETVRQRVDRKIKHERLFMGHMLLFLLYMGIATTGAIPVSGIILICWAILLVLHQTWVKSIGKRDEAIEREIQREKLLLGLEEKPKRSDTRLVLGDDGELVEIIDDEEEEKAKRSV